jgi:hypothetical protein
MQSALQGRPQRVRSDYGRTDLRPQQTVQRLSLLVFALLVSLETGCVGSGHNATAPASAPAANGLSVSPGSAGVRAGDTQQFTATLGGVTTAAVTWSVNGVAGGSAAIGTISLSGVYTAPASVPNPNSVTVKATRTFDSSASATGSVTLLNPIPVITGVNPSAIGTGSFTLSVTGGRFVSGGQILFAGTPLNTTFLSATQLSATGNAPSVGVFAIRVRNPEPGSSASGSVDLQVSGNQLGACSGMKLGPGASLNGFRAFPADSAWNLDISNAPVDLNSDAIISFIGAGTGLHADFGSGLYQGSSIGIPYLVVDGRQNPVDVNFTAYGDESDPGPMPIPANAPIEGYPAPGSGDRNVLVLNSSSCWLYELFSAYPAPVGTWNAGSAAVWDLLGNEQRPLTWTSADAAGLPIFPGLVRYDEAAGGQIGHALRFTLRLSRAAFVPPASHWASNSSNPLAAPMGMRLKVGFDISRFSPMNQVLADNGASMFLSGAPDDRWNNDDLRLLGLIRASDFEVVQMNPIYTASNLPRGLAPMINSFTANPAIVAPGTPVTLSWSASEASYVVISPEVGPARGNSVSAMPNRTTVYALFATNQYGRSTATVTVTVP